MPIEFSCGTCGKKLRAPDTAAGKRVKCPACGGAAAVPGERIFDADEVSVPAGDADDSAPQDDGGEEFDERDSMDVERKRGKRKKKKRKHRPTEPGIALAAVGIIGFVLVLMSWILRPAEGPPMQFEGPQAEQQRRIAELVQGPFMTAIYLSLLAVNSIVAAGGAAMHQGRYYGLAVAASILSIVNIFGCCCLFSTPIGIWSLVVLQRPEVKDSFT